MLTKLTADDYRNLGQQTELTWLGVDIPPNMGIKTQWRCSDGHEFLMRYKSVREGQKCPTCKGIAQRERLQYPLEKYKDLADSKGFAWLGEVPPNTKTPTLWRCQFGHEFASSYKVVSRGGCSVCKGIRQSARLRNTADDYHKLAMENDLKWIGVLPLSVQPKTEWECPKGHRFFMSYWVLQNGGACSKCRKAKKVSKPQLKVHEMIGGELNYHTPRTGLYWIDIALDTDTLFPIAIEYDCAYWHKPERDKKRDEWLIARGWSILHIRSANLVPSLSDIQAAIDRLRNGEKRIEIFLSDWLGEINADKRRASLTGDYRP